jgi:pimeloyl-ACP methyl ester carboxylesterase
MNRIEALEHILDRLKTSVVRQRIAAGEIETHYLLAGEGFPLLLVHGGGAGAVQWHRVLDTLSQHFQVIAPDVVGYGETDKPSAPYDRAFFTRWLLDFAQALELEQFHLIAASQSGPAALQVAADRPQRVKKLVLVDTAGFGRDVPLGALLGMVWLYSLASKTALQWQRRYLVHYDESLDDVLGTYAVEVARMSGGKRAFWQGKGRAVEPLPDKLFQRIQQPTLILWGEEERFFPLSHAERAERVLPDAQLRILPDAGHLSFLDQPDTFCEALLTFLNT